MMLVWTQSTSMDPTAPATVMLRAPRSACLGLGTTPDCLLWLPRVISCRLCCLSTSDLDLQGGLRVGQQGMQETGVQSAESHTRGWLPAPGCTRLHQGALLAAGESTSKCMGQYGQNAGCSQQAGKCYRYGGRQAGARPPHSMQGMQCKAFRKGQPTATR